MTQGTLTKVQGVVIELTGVKNGTSQRGPWKRHDFTVKRLTGETVKCNTFGKFDKDLIGATVEFDAEFSAKYSNYAVKGELTVSEGVETQTPEAATPTPKKRGRKPKATTSPVVVQERTVEADLESVREQAVKVFEHDVENVRNTLQIDTEERVSPQAIAVGVQALQAIRATLFIEANKRERVSAMHGR